MLYNARNSVTEFFDDYSLMGFEAKLKETKATKGKALKIFKCFKCFKCFNLKYSNA